jgi:light-regulated signal transduction histidine kinase (bacteriophytochrome)
LADSQSDPEAQEEIIMQATEAVSKPAEANAERWARELDAFMHSISHDFLAPLRAIDGFAGIVLEDHAEVLPPEARRYLRLILSNVQRMNHLVEGLKAFADLSRKGIVKQFLEPIAIVKEAWDELTRSREGAIPQFIVGNLERCDADRVLLRQVFFNLLSNAIKFTSRRENARIEVSSKKNEAGEIVYCVRDNGAGFDMRYAHQLFGLFQRLHRAEDYEGTGVGLAIVGRIVSCHGGRVWADAQPDKGAAIYFTLEPRSTALAA